MASAAIIVAAGLGLGLAAPAAAADKTTLNVVQAGANNSLQPDIESSRQSLRISSQIVEAITKYSWDGKDYRLVAGVAESWEQIAPKTWRFKLRPGLKFTNGEPLTAEAVKFTHGVYMEGKRSGPPLVGDLTISVVDELTFDVETQTPNLPTVPAQLSFLYVYPPAYFRQVGSSGFGSAPIGTGPYLLDRWQKGVSITLKANEAYWGGAPKIKQVVYRSIADEATRVAELEAGSADIVADITPGLARRVSGIRTAELKSLPSQRRIYFILNARKAPTNDVRVRQAINYAIDSEGIVKGLFGPYAKRLPGIYLPGEIGYDAAFTGYKHDPAKAKALLAEAGHPNGLTVDLHYSTDGSVLDAAVAEAVQAQLAKVGIKTVMDSAPGTIMAQKIGTNESTGLSMMSYGPIYADTSFLVTRAYFSSFARYARYMEEPAADPLTDRLGNEANSITDPKRRQEIYAQLERHVIADKAYWAPLYGLIDLYGVSKAVNWDPRPDQNFEFEKASFK